MKRRTFLSFLAYSATFTHLIGKQAYIFQDSERAKALSDAGNVLLALQKQKKNVISLVLQGRKFKRNVDHHYPHPKGVHDENSGYRVFFMDIVMENMDIFILSYIIQKDIPIC